MANKRRPRPEPPEVKETEEGVTVTYPDRKLQPYLTPLKRPRCCQKCGYGPVGRDARYATSPTNYLYECPRCVDPNTCRPTRWQEPR